jgi:hypothetical protein
VDVWRGAEVWAAVTAELRGYRQRGLAGLMTEDTVRFATARALIEAGVDPSGLRVEWPHPALRGSRVDLAVGGEPPSALIEFKFPREPTEQNAAWTMALGEVLKDFYRLATCPGDADRLFVYIETNRLRRYMAGAADRYGLDLDVEQVALHPADAARLPTTAARIIGVELAAHHVVAQRIRLVTIDDGLRLALYVVDPLGKPHGEAARLAVEESSPAPPNLPQSGSHELADNRPSRNQSWLTKTVRRPPHVTGPGARPSRLSAWCSRARTAARSRSLASPKRCAEQERATPSRQSEPWSVHTCAPTRPTTPARRSTTWREWGEGSIGSPTPASDRPRLGAMSP